MKVIKNGVKSADGSRDIIPANPNIASYYLYLTHNVIQNFNESKIKKQQELEKDLKELERNKLYAEKVEDDRKELKKLENIEKVWNLKPDFAKKINEDFNANAEETCYRYFEFLKEKYNIDKLKGLVRLKAENYFIREIEQAEDMKYNTEYLNLAISKEFLSRIVDDEVKGTFLNKIQTVEAKIKNGERISSKTLKLLGNMYYYGIKSASDQEIIAQDEIKATKIYEQIVNEKGINADAETYSNLIDIYSDTTTPLYNKTKADKLLKTAIKKGLHIKEKVISPESTEPSTFVCSDLHGEYPVYKAIISKLKVKDKLYILGDVIDRGPDGIKILQDVMKRKKQGQVEFLIGNHELLMIQSLFLNNAQCKNAWKANGGDITEEAFKRLSSNERNKMKEFLLDSYVYKNIDVNSQKVHLVHAKAIQDKNDNDNKTVREMIAGGKVKLIHEAVDNRQHIAKPRTFTVIGHSPTDNNMIEYKAGFLDIDCGAGYFDNASLVNLTNGTVKYFDVKHERENENNRQNER